MHFLLSSMSVVYVLTTPIPEDCEDATVEQLRKRAKWDNDDYVCRGLILKGMSDLLFEIFQNAESRKELWDSLEAKYMAEDASSKKFLVSCIIDKLPPFWKDFKHTLKHKKEELTLVELGSYLRIEESLRAQDSDKPKGNNVVGPTEPRVLGKPNLNYLGVWGCKAVVRLLDPKLKTLRERGIECIFVGYAEHFKAFRFYVIEPNESVSINSIIESKDVIFDENRFSSVPRPNQRSLINGTKDIGGSVVPKEVTKKVVTQRPEPDLRKAMKSQDVAFEKEVINDDMDSILGNNTWVLADLPPGCKPLGYKWVFKRKLKVDGTIEKFKARLLIQGFRQKSGIYYFDTYPPVAHINTIRLLIAMASIHNLIIHQMDVKTTFLNGELDEEQEPMQWHQKFDEVVLSSGYLLNQAEKFDLTKEFLSSKFSMKDMGDDDVIRIKHEINGIVISQSHYIEKVLKKFNYFDCTPVSTPTDTSEKLMPNNGQAVSQLEYSRVIDCLMYAMTCTRPDIDFAVGKLSRYTSNPSTQHWQAIQRVLKYLKKTMDNSLTYTGYPLVLEGYIDASWISNAEDNSDGFSIP
ncbi:zinc finger, CCHC-type containing protein [Tanacetum coccineum]